jgi:hypothetical protein
MTVFQVPIGGLEEFATVLTNSTVTTIVDGDDAIDGVWYVAWVQANENANGTPSLTMDLYDGTTAYLLGTGGVVYNVKALTAGQSVTFSEGYVVPKGWKLRAKSNNAGGQITIVGTRARRLA